MSKTQLIKFLNNLEHTELKEQVLDLYQRFKNVKEFYDFSFNPNETKRVEEAKLKISKEYFPDNGRKAKKRRSVAQKIITHLQKLEVNPIQIADLMLFNLEIAQIYTQDNYIKQEAFYKSMLTSFKQSLSYSNQHMIQEDFKKRIDAIVEFAVEQEWVNREGFIRARNELL